MEHAVTENGVYVFTGGCGNFIELVLRETVQLPEVMR
jgi:hypothetical protein